MQPRFSILNLLVVTTYIAVTFAGLLDPEVIGGVSIFVIWLAAVILFASRAAGAPSPRRTFARGFMVVCLICASAAMLTRNPDQALVNNLEQRGMIAPDAQEYDRALGYARLSMAHGSLALGLLGGYVAQRQYGAGTPLTRDDFLWGEGSNVHVMAEVARVECDDVRDTCFEHDGS